MILSEGIWGLLNCLNRARSKERPAPGVIREEAFSRTRRSSYFASLAQLYDTSALLSLLGDFCLLSCRFFRHGASLSRRLRKRRFQNPLTFDPSAFDLHLVSRPTIPTARHRAARNLTSRPFLNFRRTSVQNWGKGLSTVARSFKLLSAFNLFF